MLVGATSNPRYLRRVNVKGWPIVLAAGVYACRSAPPEAVMAPPDGAVGLDAAAPMMPEEAMRVRGAQTCTAATAVSAGWWLDDSVHAVPSGACFGYESRKFYQAPPGPIAVWVPRYREVRLTAVADCALVAQNACTLPNAIEFDYKPAYLYLPGETGVAPPRIVLSADGKNSSEFLIASVSIESPPLQRGTCAAPVPLEPNTVVIENSDDTAQPQRACDNDVRAITLPPRTSLRTYAGIDIQACCGTSMYNLTDQPRQALISGYGQAPYAVQLVPLPPNLCCEHATEVVADGRTQRVELDQPGLRDVSGCGAEHRWFRVTIPARQQLQLTLAGLADDGTGMKLWVQDQCDGAVIAAAEGLTAVQTLAVDNPRTEPRTVLVGAAEYGAGIIANYGDLTMQLRALP